MMERHIRWNWEKSLDMRNCDGVDGVRYHFVVVDDRDRSGILNEILEPLGNVGEVSEIRRVEGGVGGSRFRYLFCSYDSLVGPDILELHKIGKVVRRDRELRERLRGNIEDYVARVYE